MVTATEIFLGLVNNLVVLILLVAIYGTIINRIDQLSSLNRQISLGVLFGAFATGSMYLKIPVAEGVLVDQRNAIVALSGAIGGPIAAIISAFFAGIYRLQLGGIGATAGFIGVFLAASAGALIYKARPSQRSAGFLALASIGATLIILPGFLFVGDWSFGFDLMMTMSVPFGAAVSIGIFIGLFLLTREDRRFESEKNRLVSEKERREAYQEMMRANRAKSEFLATMSHELRTPLNAILGFSDVLQRDVSGSLPIEKRVEYAGDIHESGQHLLSLINDVLDISTIEAGKHKINKTKFDLNIVVESCLKNFAEGTISKNVSINLESPDTPILMIAGERATAQILLNLLSNAVKFSHDGGSVDLVIQESVDHVTITVTDHGIGISEDRLENITEPFSRSSDHAEIAADGTGLGLSIVKGLVDLHGGKLTIQSELGVGTTISVELPKNTPTD